MLFCQKWQSTCFAATVVLIEEKYHEIREENECLDGNWNFSKRDEYAGNK